MAKTAARYYVTLGSAEEPEAVELVLEGREARVAWRGRAWVVDARALAGGGMSLLVQHRSYDVDLTEEDEGTLRVAIGEARERVAVVDERGLRMRGAARRRALEGRQSLTAPMPGRVARVLVQVGDEVQEGQGLVVVEAMKMENELRSPRAGRVEEITVGEGQTVEGGARLVVVA